MIQSYHPTSTTMYLKLLSLIVLFRSVLAGETSKGTRLKCKKGSFYDRDNDNCTLCPPATYSTSAGASKCTPCPEGHITFHDGSNSKMPCHACPPGTYGLINPDRGYGECEFCDPGTASNKTGVLGSCDLCPPGTFSDFFQLECTDCPVDTFSDEEGKLFGCRECPYGTYQDVPGSTTCKKCPPLGETPLRGFGQCDRCDVTEDFVKGKCICKKAFIKTSTGFCTCPPKMKQRGGRCVACSKQELKNFRRNKCVVCISGRFLDEKRKRCRQCPKGTKNNRPNATSCRKCKHTFMVRGKLKCGCGKGRRENRSGACVKKL